MQFRLDQAGLRVPVPFKTGEWELYNLAKDPGEMHDVSKENAEKK